MVKESAAARRKRLLPGRMKQVIRIIDEVTYKPGFSLQVEEGIDVIWIRVMMSRPLNANTKRVRKRGVLSGPLHVIDGHATNRAVIEACYEAFVRFEMHEAREFFRFKGRKLFDPHRPVR